MYQIRPEIMIFAHALEKQMWYNEKRGKGDEWKEMDYQYLFKRLMDEVDELKQEIDFTEPEELKVRHESLDVGSMACFIFYNALVKTVGEAQPKADER
jgi:hypothetical protein